MKWIVAMVCSLNLNEAEKYWGRIAMRMNQNCAESLRNYSKKQYLFPLVTRENRYT